MTTSSKDLALGDGAVGKTSLIRRFRRRQGLGRLHHDDRHESHKKDLRIESPSKATT